MNGLHFAGRDDPRTEAWQSLKGFSKQRPRERIQDQRALLSDGDACACEARGFLKDLTREEMHDIG